MDRIEPESFGLFCPDAADVFIRREASKGREPAGEIVCRDEIIDMSAELVVAVVAIAFDGFLLDRPVHPLDLAICPGMLGFGQPVVDAVSPACSIERMRFDFYTALIEHQRRGDVALYRLQLIT